MRTIRNLINQEKKVYILLRTRAIQYRFMSDADRVSIPREIAHLDRSN